MEKNVLDSIEKESAAIKVLLETLTPLPAEVRAEVIRYVSIRLGISQARGEPIRTSLMESEVRTSTERPALAGDTVHIKDFTGEKKPKSANEMAAVIAYYLANLAAPTERKDVVTL